MLGLGKLLHSHQGQEARDDTHLVNNLVQRISESLVIEDRRAALNELRNVLADDPSAQAAFASLGFNTIINVLQNDIDDPVVVRTSLECIAAVTGEKSAEQQPNAQVSAVNAEQLARTTGAIPLIISLLNDRQAQGLDAFHIKYLILQIIQSLLIANVAYTQQAILQIPIGISQLVEILGEQQEVLRNEGVLLLHRLVQNNPETQKVAAFNGCLDKSFAIMREEGFLMGGIVVEDCLHLVQALITDNEANHRMFHELGFYSALVQSIDEHVASLQQQQQQQQEQQSIEGFLVERNNNIAAAIGVLHVCIADSALTNPHASGNQLHQQQQQQQHVLPLSSISALATSRGVTTNVRSAAWSCLNVAVLSGTMNIQALGNLPLGALHAIWAGESPQEQSLSADFAATALKDNPMSQTMVASMLIQNASSSPEPQASLLAGLYAPGSVHEQYLGSRAAVALAPLLVHNDDVKQLLLAAQIPRQKTSPLAACAQRLATSVTMHGAKPEGQFLVGNYAMTLSCWIHAFPPAVNAFLDSVKQTPFLVGVLLTEGQFGAGGPVIRGMCALILGLSAIYAPAGGPVESSALKKAIHSQITTAKYVKALDDLMIALTKNATPTSFVAPAWWIEWLEGVVAEIHGEIIGGTMHPTSTLGSVAGGGGGAPSMQQLQQQPHGHQSAIPQPSSTPPSASLAAATLNIGNASAVNGVSNSALPPPSTVREPPSSSFLVAQSTAMPEYLQQRPHPPLPQSSNENTTALVARLQQEIEDLKARNAELEQEAFQSKNDLLESQSALSKVEADLEALSSAYASLDAHANTLQGQLNEKVAAVSSSSPKAANGSADYSLLLAKAKEEAEVDAAAAMEDLLVCLGQQEEKIAELEAKLQQFNI